MSDVAVDESEAARLAALPPKFQADGKTLHLNYNEGQEEPPVPFAEDHQSIHPVETHVCGTCGQASDIGVPADPFSMVWECPHCGNKNRTAGLPPVELAKAQAAEVAAKAAVAALLAGEAPVHHVAAGDALEAGDKQS